MDTIHNTVRGLLPASLAIWRNCKWPSFHRWSRRLEWWDSRRVNVVDTSQYPTLQGSRGRTLWTAREWRTCLYKCANNVTGELRYQAGARSPFTGDGKAVGWEKPRDRQTDRQRERERVFVCTWVLFSVPDKPVCPPAASTMAHCGWLWRGRRGPELQERRNSDRLRNEVSVSGHTGANRLTLIILFYFGISDGHFLVTTVLRESGLSLIIYCFAILDGHILVTTVLQSSWLSGIIDCFTILHSHVLVAGAECLWLLFCNTWWSLPCYYNATA